MRKSVVPSKCFRNKNESQLDFLPYVSHGPVFWLQVPVLCTGEVRKLFLPQHSVMVGARFAHGGYRNMWWQAGCTAEAPVFPSWHDRCLCNAFCSQSQPHLGNVDLELKKQKKDILNSTVLFHVLIHCFYFIYLKK